MYALGTAAEQGDVAGCVLLAAAGVDVNDTFGSDFGIMTPLAVAVYTNQVSAGRGSNPNRLPRTPNRGVTP